MEKVPTKDHKSSVVTYEYNDIRYRCYKNNIIRHINNLKHCQKCPGLWIWQRLMRTK